MGATELTDQEINELVARKLGVDGCHHSPRCSDAIIPAYATDIKAAWEIVEWFNKQNPYNITRLEWWDGRWLCHFGPEEKITWIAKADNAPLAICRAFLELP